MIALTNEQINVIKNGYKRVQVTVSFPNGERTAITNDDIVYESLSFNESICTSDIFRFGNAEASSVSFETVGVENILGYTISVKLTYEYQNPEYPHDTLTFDVPYGTFVVTSCPRNHENMTHRRVQAVSRTSDNNSELMPQVEQDKLNSRYTNKNDYEPDLWYLLDSVNGMSREYTSTLVADQSTATTYSVWTLNYTVTADQTNYAVQLVAKFKAFVLENCLYTVTGEHDTGVDDFVDQNIAILGSDVDQDILNEIKKYGYMYINDSGNGLSRRRATYPDFTYLQGCYPYINLHTSTLYIPDSVRLKLRLEGSTEYIADETINPYPTFTITKHESTDYTMPMTLAINHTLETTSVSGIPIYSFSNAYTMADIITGYAELFAGFSRRNRDGSYSVIRLDNSDPYALTASDVEGQAWWDEYSIADIGSIKYCWTDGKGDHEGEYTWNPDGSVYDMTDNGLFKNIKLRVKTVSAVSKMTDPTIYYVYSGNWYAYNGTEFVQMGEYETKSSIIEYMLDTFFLPYADIHFTPVDMNIRGLPFLQCGDAIIFTAADGTVINSYILNHTFSGIQHITENLDTVQGEVLE